MKYSVYEPIVLGLLLSFALSWVVIMLSQVMEKSKYPALVFGELGKASLVIMFLHQFIHFNLRKLGVDSDVGIILAGLVIPYLAYLAFGRTGLTRRVFLGQR
jgi:fucose 4-O-acetylase-like acetyltransferase